MYIDVKLRCTVYTCTPPCTTSYSYCNSDAGAHPIMWMRTCNVMKLELAPVYSSRKLDSTYSVTTLHKYMVYRIIYTYSTYIAYREQLSGIDEYIYFSWLQCFPVLSMCLSRRRYIHYSTGCAYTCFLVLVQDFGLRFHSNFIYEFSVRLQTHYTCTVYCWF